LGDYAVGAFAEQVYNKTMKARVLIVDDAPFIREILAQLILKAGYEIAGQAHDGEEAVTLCLKLKPEIVFLDIVLPQKNGIQVAADILRALPQTKIIATSSGDNEVIIQKAIEAGCCDFVAKPFSAEAVIGSINKAVLQSATERKTS
jgi:two-component system chemotaxis response regulator CheY